MSYLTTQENSLKGCACKGKPACVLLLLLLLLLLLFRILYQLWTGQFSELLASHFKAIDQLNAYEKDVVLGKSVEYC